MSASVNAARGGPETPANPADVAAGAAQRAFNRRIPPNASAQAVLDALRRFEGPPWLQGAFEKWKAEHPEFLAPAVEPVQSAEGDIALWFVKELPEYSAKPPFGASVLPQSRATLTRPSYSGREARQPLSAKSGEGEGEGEGLPPEGEPEGGEGEGEGEGLAPEGEPEGAFPEEPEYCPFLMSGWQVEPPSGSPATGFGLLSVGPGFTASITIEHDVANATAAHLHNADGTYTFDLGSVASPIYRSFTYEEILDLIENGLDHIDIHGGTPSTVQILGAPACDNMVFCEVTLSGDQVVPQPETPSGETARADFLLEPATVALFMRFEHSLPDATALHIHAQDGSATVTFPDPASPLMHLFTPPQMGALWQVGGFEYLDLHSDPQVYPDGELRSPSVCEGPQAPVSVCTAVLSGEQVVPPTQCMDPAAAYLFANFDTLFFRVRIEHDVQNATAIHIHAGDGTLLKDFGNPASPFDYVLSPADLEDLESAEYMDIHSSAYPDGAVRGWFACEEPGPEPAILTLGVVGEGNTSPPPGAHEYESGQQVWVQAYPDWGSTFTHWTGGVPQGEDPESAEIDVPMTEDRSLTAHFERTHWRLTTQLEGQGTIYNPGQGDFWYPLGNTAYLSAYPAEHWRFIEWDMAWDGGSETIETPSASWTMNADTTATAVFHEYAYTLYIQAQGQGSTYPAPGLYYIAESGAPFSIAAAPFAGYVFRAWSGDLPAGADAHVTPLTGYMTQDREIVAEFVPEFVQVPDVSGLTQLQAQGALGMAGLLLGTVGDAYSETVPEGIVLEQTPGAGAQVAWGAAVDIVVSLGRCLRVTPAVWLLMEADAAAAIEAAGLTLGAVTEEPSMWTPLGRALRTNPAEGVVVSCGAPVDLVVSSGDVAAGDTYVPGCALECTWTLEYTGAPLTALGVSVELPEGWTLTAQNVPEGAWVFPALGSGGTLEYAWGALTGFPKTMTLTLHAPVEATGDQDIVAWGEYRTSGSAMITLDQILRLEEAEPEGDCPALTAGRNLNLDRLLPELPEGGGGQQMMMMRMGGGCITDCEAGLHSGDPNGNWHVDLTELLRIIQFFNSGGYHCADDPESTEDGYAPGPGEDHSCAAHDSDYNPQDWQVTLTELLRFIQFWSAGLYSAHDDGEDGFLDGTCLDTAITLNGPANVSLECGQSYTDPGATASDLCERDVTHLIQTEIEPHVGAQDYDIHYRVTYKEPQTGEPVEVGSTTRHIDVADNEPPVITLLGNTVVVHECGGVYVDAGAAAEDACGVQLPPGNIHLDYGAFDSSAVGDYVLTYTATDLSGNAATPVTRTVQVRDTVAPAITLVSGPEIEVPCGQAFVDPGVVAMDACCGDLSASVQVGGDAVDTSANGTYVITYDVTDCNGNAAVSLERTIYVNTCPVDFDDVNLQTAFREALGFGPTQEVYPADLAGLIRLDAPLRGIEDLTGIEFAVDLQELDLHGNCIDDIAPLSGLVNLRLLNLHDNHIVSIAALQGLTALDVLWLSRNRIVSLQPLAANMGLAGDNGPNFTRWDRISLNLNSDLDANAQNYMNTLESRGVFVWRPRAIATRAKQAGWEDLAAEITLRYNSGVVTLDGYREFYSRMPQPGRKHGEHGLLKVLDKNGVEVSEPVSFGLEMYYSNEEDPPSGHSDFEVYNEAEVSVIVPITAPIERISYFDAATMQESVLLDDAGATRHAADCAPADQPGDPIPISLKLIHGDASLPDDRAFVIMLLGDGFELERLGDPTLTLAQNNVSYIYWSNAMADSWNFILAHEPYRFYQNHIQVYRLDVISRAGENAFGGTINGNTWNYDPAALSRILRVATQTGIVSNKRIISVDGGGSGWGSYWRGLAHYTGSRDNRRMVALHELGHAVGNLRDEYEFIHGGNCELIGGCVECATARRSNTADVNIVSRIEVIDGIRTDRIPRFDEIPWRHWLIDPSGQADPVSHLGELLPDESVDTCDINSNQATCPDCDCHCDFPMAGEEYIVPLPTCEPSGNFYNCNTGLIAGRVEWPEPNLDDPGEGVGLYEGGGYHWRRVYRPQLRCRMRSGNDTADGTDATEEYCTVCRERIIQELLFFSKLTKGVAPPAGTAIEYDHGTDQVSLQVVIHPAIEGQTRDYSYEWKLDGVPQEGATTDSFLFDGISLSGDHIVSVTIWDDNKWLSPANNNDILIQMDADATLETISAQQIRQEEYSWELVESID